MEIERKFLVREVPKDLSRYVRRDIEQGYLNVSPVVRIRRDGDDYYLTYKSDGMMAREEYNLPLTQKAYEHMRSKIDGKLITKTRYNIPYKDDLLIELDIFSGCYAGVMLAEVEFPTTEAADAFIPPAWFGEDVTYDGRFHNSAMSQAQIE